MGACVQHPLMLSCHSLLLLFEQSVCVLAGTHSPDLGGGLHSLPALGFILPSFFRWKKFGDS